jgi:hypothetical protein
VANSQAPSGDTSLSVTKSPSTTRPVRKRPGVFSTPTMRRTVPSYVITEQEMDELSFINPTGAALIGAAVTLWTSLPPWGNEYLWLHVLAALSLTTGGACLIARGMRVKNAIKSTSEQLEE